MIDDINLSLDVENVKVEDVYDHILFLVKTAEKYTEYTPDQKHKFVLDQVRALLGAEVFHRYFSMLDGMISFICKLGKHTELLKGINDITKGIFKCCTK